MTTTFPPEELVCPVDGASDTIQKVSAIVNGASVGARGGYSAPQTLLQMLAHKKPVKKQVWTQHETVAGLFLIIPAALCAFISGVQLLTQPGQTGFNDVFEIIGSIVIIVLFTKLVKERQKVREVLQPAAPSPEEFEHILWEDLYYCHRHDVVFIPSTSFTAPPQRMDELLQSTRMALEEMMAMEAASPVSSEPDIIQTRHMGREYMA